MFDKYLILVYNGGMMKVRKPWHHKDVLEGMYVEQKLSMRQIAQILGTTASNVKYWMDRFNIQSRQFSIGDINRGKKLTDDAKAHLSEFAKKRFSNPANHPMSGRKHTEESKRKMSETKRRKRQERLSKQIS